MKQMTKKAALLANKFYVSALGNHEESVSSLLMHSFFEMTIRIFLPFFIVFECPLMTVEVTRNFSTV